MTPGLLIAAPRSGSGKTTVTLGLLRALTNAGMTVQPFKSGPDYIDPAFQSAAARRPSFNLDSWGMAPDRLAALAAEAENADIALAEGVMGLFDGAATPGEAGNGSSADIAAALGWPVLLVMDVSGQSQSAAAIAQGFRSLRPDVQIAGVILNRVASERHRDLISGAMAAAGIPVLGAIPRSADLTLPERHLGLVQAAEQADLDAMLDRFGAIISAHVDINRILEASHRAPAKAGTQPRRLNGPPNCAGALAPSERGALPPPGQRIALASDAAFTFTYAHLLADWRAAGAEVLPFSPLADEAPDPGADTIWLPGGYPELHAGRIAGSTRFHAGLRSHALTRPIHGECGGYMVLGSALIDADGRTHEMAGLLGLVTSFADRRLHLGYRRARLLAPMPGFPEGALLNGHEFHYSTIIDQPDSPLATVTDAEGRAVAATGSRRGQVTGSFFHLIAAASEVTS
ncbi:cobyrinate a,c-diamide synthase [Sphingobium bisphenolivorans]|uniref:cobyrinate a,c-diamide synthase n=1 Tax=Sphingobium bisphenolivorans TaxID=1335760 RepID=UPI0003A9821C|nr:cobyrinate a,c-diamide synthase [Sphingobium bisphenolivorans]